MWSVYAGFFLSIDYNRIAVFSQYCDTLWPLIIWLKKLNKQELPKWDCGVDMIDSHGPWTGSMVDQRMSTMLAAQCWVMQMWICFMIGRA